MSQAWTLFTWVGNISFAVLSALYVIPWMISSLLRPSLREWRKVGAILRGHRE